MAVTTINIDSQVLTFANLAAFPITGTVKTIYIAEDTDLQYYWDGTQYVLLGSVGTVTSVGLSMPSAFTVANSPITSSGDIAVTGAGTTSQYVRGDGSLANFPSSTGGGASQSFYLNGSVSQGTFGGVAFRELDRVPILGAGTDFNINTNGYIQSFITDANVPNQLNIPAGNWNFEMYFSASSGGGSPNFYLELYKWDGASLTLIATSSANPEAITNGTTIDLYVTALAVPQTALLATDRLAIRVYVNNSGRTITLHTENNHLCQVITTFSTGLTALNGLTDQVQNFATGTSGNDFAISSATNTHTFNLPTASSLNRGALSSADWTTFNDKVGTGPITGSGLTMATNRLLGRSTAGTGAVEEIVIGSGLTLSGGTLTAAGGGITIGTTAITSGTVGRILFEGAGNVVQQSANLFWDNTNSRLSLGTSSPVTGTRLTVLGSGTGSGATTTFGLQVHDSTGNNNALVVRDDGKISFNSLPNATIGDYRFSSLSQDASLFFESTVSNTIILRSRANTNTAIHKNIDIIGNEVGLSQAGDRALTVRNSGGGGGFTETVVQGNVSTAGLSNLLIIRNPGNLHGTSRVLFQRNTQNYGAIDGRSNAIGTNNYIAISAQNAAQTSLNEVIRFIGNGNVLIGTTNEGASATKTLVINNGIAPSGNVTHSFQQYSADIVAGNAAPHFRTENGDIVKIYRVGGWGLPTGAFTRTTFDTATVTTEQLAERVAALIQDLRDNHQLLKA